MRASIVVAILLSITAGVAAGEPVVKFESGDAVITLAKLRELRKKADPKEESPIDSWVWVAYEGFEPQQRPLKASPSSGALPLEFMATVNKLYFYQYDGLTWWLVGSGQWGKDLKILGWVPENYMVLDHRAWKDVNSTLYDKALIVNTRRFLEEEKVIEKLVQPPPMLLAPEPKAKAKPPFRLFNVYFVYGDSHPRTNAKEQETGYLLLGKRGQFNLEGHPEDGPKGVILGWVHKNRISRWKTREALRWETELPRTEPVITYQPLKEGFNDEQAIDEIIKKRTMNVITEPWRAGKPLPWPYEKMRYPVLAIAKDLSGKESMQFSVQGNVLRKIGLVGGFVNEDGKEEASADELAAMERTLEYLQIQSNNVEMLFVIDDSESMRKWFPHAAETILETIKMVKSEKRSLKIGLTYYSDTPLDQRETLEQLKKAVITSGTLDYAESDKVQKFLKELPGHPERPGYDDPEQVFLGLRMGVHDAQFSLYSRKILIHIGQTRDHDENKDGQFSKEKEIAALLTKEGQTPIEYYAFHVPKNNRGEFDNLLRKQTEKIAELFKEGTKKSGKERHAGYYRITEEYRMKEDILARFKAQQAEVSKIQADIENVRRGRFDLIDRLDPEFIKKLEREIGADRLEKFRKTKGAQLFSTAYVWEKNPKKQTQIRPQVLVNHGELKELREMLDAFFGNPDKGDVPSADRLAKLVIRLQEGLEEEDSARLKGQEITVANLMKVTKGFGFQSPILKMSAADYKNFRPDSPAARQLLQDLSKRHFLIEDMLNKEKWEYTRRDSSDSVGLTRKTKLTPTTAGEFDRGFYLHVGGREVRWYWLDHETEWP